MGCVKHPVFGAGTSHRRNVVADAGVIECEKRPSEKRTIDRIGVNEGRGYLVSEHRRDVGR